MSSQTPQERQALHAAWSAHPQVVALTAAVTAHAARTRHLPDAEAITASLRFAREWIAEHGELPDSGILCD
jgi:hypothetical protein